MNIERAMEHHTVNCLHFRSTEDTILFVIYIIVSIGIPLLNYYVFTDVFEYPVTFTMWQFLFTGLVALIWNVQLPVNELETVNSKITDKKTFKWKCLYFLIPGTLMGINVSLMNMGLAKTSVTLQTVIKATGGIWTLLLDLVLFKVKPDKIGVLMVLTCLFGMSYIAMSALLYQEFTS